MKPKSVIFLVRHPFNALWAEFQRRKSGGHASSVVLSQSTLEYDFPKFASCMSCKWLYFVAAHVHLRSMGVNLFVLKYEDLQQRTVKSLRAMLHFVGEDSAAEDPARLDCAMDMIPTRRVYIGRRKPLPSRSS